MRILVLTYVVMRVREVSEPIIETLLAVVTQFPATVTDDNLVFRVYKLIPENPMTVAIPFTHQLFGVHDELLTDPFYFITNVREIWILLFDELEV